MSHWEKPILFKNVTAVNEGKSWVGDVLVKKNRIEQIAPQINRREAVTEVDGTGKTLIPGVIDEHVHFREPGLTQKADISSESQAAVAGGVTSFMEMPNTKPPVLTQEILEDKYARAARSSAANYSFYMGVSNDNRDEVLQTNDKKKEVCGIKIFMGSSTGNMLVDKEEQLSDIFANAELLIATHCESEDIIKANLAKMSNDNVRMYPVIRSVEACLASSSFAISLAKKYNTRLHIVHLTTGKETALFTNDIPLRDKRITSEVCVHHLHFTADDYSRLGTKIQCNPPIKSAENKMALWTALLDDKIDTIATDHAPHTFEEKQRPYPTAPCGIPLVQHSLLLMLYYVQQKKISLEKVVEKMCHAPATCFRIRERGYLREGYYADLVLIDQHQPVTTTKDNIRYKCGWSPLEGFTFPATIEKTWVNGYLAYENGLIHDTERGLRLVFDR